MLTFMGHWPEAVPIPGTNQYLNVPFAGHRAGESDHAQHCHDDSAACSDVPVMAGAGFALLNQAVAFAVVSGLLWLVALHWWRPRASNALLPELQPPRLAMGSR